MLVQAADKLKFAEMKSNEKEFENNILDTITYPFCCWINLFNRFEKNIYYSFIYHYYIDDWMVVD